MKISRLSTATFGTILLLAAAFISGCAEIQPPPPSEILQAPLGKSQLRIGMSKSEVRSLWGDPDGVEPAGDGQYGSLKELWVYEARFPDLSALDMGYATRTRRLLFDGDTLVSTGT